MIKHSYHYQKLQFNLLIKQIRNDYSRKKLSGARLEAGVLLEWFGRLIKQIKNDNSRDQRDEGLNVLKKTI